MPIRRIDSEPTRALLERWPSLLRLSPAVGAGGRERKGLAQDGEVEVEVCLLRLLLRASLHRLDHRSRRRTQRAEQVGE